MGLKITEEQFIDQLNTKQPEGFRVLFRKFYAVMVDFGLNYVSSKEAAEDIVQEIFAEIWECNRRFDSYGSFKTFLYTSVRNAGLNDLKHEKVKQKYIAYFQDNDEAEEDSDFKIMEEEIYRTMFTIVEALPKRCKEVFELHLEGKKNEEIALLLNISILTVKTQKSRAMQVLREQMGDLFVIALAWQLI